MVFLQPYTLASGIEIPHGYLTLKQIVVNHKEKYIEFTTNIYLSKEDYINGFAPVEGFPEVRGHLYYDTFANIPSAIINWFTNTITRYENMTEEEAMGSDADDIDMQLFILRGGIIDIEE